MYLVHRPQCSVHVGGRMFNKVSLEIDCSGGLGNISFVRGTICLYKSAVILWIVLFWLSTLRLSIRLFVLLIKFLFMVCFAQELGKEAQALPSFSREGGGKMNWTPFSACMLLHRHVKSNPPFPSHAVFGHGKEQQVKPRTHLTQSIRWSFW